MTTNIGHAIFKHFLKSFPLVYKSFELIVNCWLFLVTFQHIGTKVMELCTNSKVAISTQRASQVCIKDF